MRRTGSSNPIVQTGKYSNDRCSFLASQYEHLDKHFFFFVKEIPVLTLNFLINILLEYLEDLLRNFDYLDGKPEVLFFYWCLWK